MESTNAERLGTNIFNGYRYYQLSKLENMKPEKMTDEKFQKQLSALMRAGEYRSAVDFARSKRWGTRAFLGECRQFESTRDALIKHTAHVNSIS